MLETDSSEILEQRLTLRSSLSGWSPAASGVWVNGGGDSMAFTVKACARGDGMAPVVLERTRGDGIRGDGWGLSVRGEELRLSWLSRRRSSPRRESGDRGDIALVVALRFRAYGGTWGTLGGAWYVPWSFDSASAWL